MTPAWALRPAEWLRDGVVSPDVFNHVVDRLRDFVVPSHHALATAAGKRTVHLDLEGVLSHGPRQHADESAALVEVERLVLPDCMGTAPWDHRPLVQVLVGEVVNRGGAPEGLIAVDPSRVPKRGTHAVGVNRPWCGQRGTVDHGPGGVSRGAVARAAQAVRDCRLSLPQDWGRDQHRRQACHVPADVSDRMRPDPCVARRDRWQDQVPHGWGTGDEALGRHTPCRGERRQRGERDVLGVPGHTTVRDLAGPWPASQGRGRRPNAPGPSVRAWRQARPAEAWTRLTGRDGATGPVGSERSTRRVPTRLHRTRTGPAAWRGGTRRPLADDRTSAGNASPEAPAQDDRERDDLPPTAVSGMAREAPALAELARLINAGLGMEARFTRGQAEAGMDADQVHTWQGWHHHMTLSLISVGFLLGETHRGQPVTPAVTLPQVRYGLRVVRMAVVCTRRVPASCRQVPRQFMRNELARFYHHRTRQWLPPKK